ncbi:MAG: nuclear transport factor 2 family protein [Saprospiraceae bacterium]|nr:nuclear transport factor 2 family protein [Lewinella sp.]
MINKKHLFLVLFCILSGILFSQKYPTGNYEDPQQYLEQFRKVYIQAMQQEDPAILMAYYAENVRLMPEFQKTILGKEQVLLYHQAFFDRFDVKQYSRRITEVLDLGEQVAETGSFLITIIPGSTSEPQTVEGKYINIWEKNDRDLSLITETWNYNEALPFEEQLRFTSLPQVNIALQAHHPIDDPVSFELAALNRLMEATIKQHDAGIWSQFYADEGSFLYSRNPMYSGKTELEQFLVQHAAEIPIFEQLDIRNDRIDDLGDYVIEYASHIAIIRNGNFSGVFTGKDLRIWRREPNGSLKIFRHIAMYD